ncbi:MAG: hypothetical protein GY940_08315 [bacterium]|nr:hypothetical protein [bacterium]
MNKLNRNWVIGSVGFLILLFFVSGTAYAIKAKTVKPGEPRFEVWKNALDKLIKIDDTLASGQRQKVTAELKSAVQEWTEPFSGIAKAYLECLDIKQIGTIDSLGVVLFVEWFREMKNIDLKMNLENLILNLLPVRRDAGALILLHRAYGEEDSRSVVTLCLRILREYPDTALRSYCLVKLGIAQYKLKQFGEAISPFREFFQSDVNDEFLSSAGVINISSWEKINRHIAACYISSCYEKSGRYGQAYDWIDRAKDYPYQSYCGTCDENQYTFVKRKMDKMAMAAGGWLAIRRTAENFGSVWYCWLALLTWFGLAISTVIRTPHTWSRLVFWTVPVMLAITAAAAIDYISTYVGPDFITDIFQLLRVPSWMPPVARLVMILILIALLLRKNKSAPAYYMKAVTVAVTGLFLAVWFPWFLEQITYINLNHLIYFPMEVLQRFSFIFIPLPLSIIASAFVAILILMRSKRKAQLTRNL